MVETKDTKPSTPGHVVDTKVNEATSPSTAGDMKPADTTVTKPVDVKNDAENYAYMVKVRTR